MSATKRPLQGFRVLLTRRSGQSSALRERLAGLGARVVEAPMIDVVAPRDYGAIDRALHHLETYAWVLFTSGNAVRMVADRMRALGLPDTRLCARKIGSIGPMTTETLRACFPAIGIAAQPATDFRADGLMDALGTIEGLTVLLPTSDRARDELPAALRAGGAQVDVVVAYHTIVSKEARERLDACFQDGFDLVVFASPSAVEGFVSASGQRGSRIPAAVIGPTTEQVARAAGLDVRVVATPSTAEGLVAAILSFGTR